MASTRAALLLASARFGDMTGFVGDAWATGAATGLSLPIKPGLEMSVSTLVVMFKSLLPRFDLSRRLEARPPLAFEVLPVPVLCRRERRLLTAPSFDSSSTEAFGVVGFEPRKDGASGWFTGVTDFFNGDRLRRLIAAIEGVFDGEATCVPEVPLAVTNFVDVGRIAGAAKDGWLAMELL